MQFLQALTFFVVIVIFAGIFINLCNWVGKMIAPAASRLLARCLPPADTNRPIELPFAFNAAFWEDGRGGRRTANTFEEWLSRQPERFRKTEDHFLNRIAFERFKRGERQVRGQRTYA